MDISFITLADIVSNINILKACSCTAENDFNISAQHSLITQTIL